MSDDTKAELEAEREAFQQWYVENAFDFGNNPLGSRQCGQQWRAWRARARPAPELLDPAAHAPIARVTVAEDGTVTKATLYAPTLPAGEHDLWCAPVAPPRLDRDCLELRMSRGDEHIMYRITNSALNNTVFPRKLVEHTAGQMFENMADAPKSAI